MILDSVIREHNAFAKAYQKIGEEVEIQRQIALQNNESVSDIQMLFNLKPGVDRHRCNFQRTNEFAAIF